MNRRKFFKTTSATAIAMSLPLSLKAEDGLPNSHEVKQVHIGSEISANHGHEFSMNIVEVVEMFAATQGGATQTINIQGQSGHPHAVELTQDMLVTLLGEQSLEVESTVVFGHAHKVLITLEVLES